MNPEQLPVPENEAIITNQQHLEANIPEAIKHGGELEGLEGNAEAVEQAHEAAVQSMAVEETPFGNLSPEGVLFEPKLEAVSDKKTSKFGSMMRKVAAVVGIGIAGTTAVQAQSQIGTVEKQGNKIENLKEIAAHEPIHDVTMDEEIAWNNYIDFVKAKGLIDNPELDNIQFSKNLVAEFNKQTETPLDWHSIRSIQNAIDKIKELEIARVNAGKAVVVDKNDNVLPVGELMKNISSKDGIPGRQSVSYKFPPAIEKTITIKNLKLHDEKTNKDYEIPVTKDIAYAEKLITPKGEGIND